MYFHILELVLLFQSSTERLSRYIQKAAYLDDIDICEILLGFNLPLWLLEYRLKGFSFDWEEIRFRTWFANNYINKQQNQPINSNNSSWIFPIPNPNILLNALTDIFLPFESGFEEREFTTAVYNEFKLFKTIVGDIMIPALVLETVYIYSNMWTFTYIKHLESKIKENCNANLKTSNSIEQALILKYTNFLNEKSLDYILPSNYKLEFPIEDLYIRLEYMRNNDQKINVLEDNSQVENAIRKFSITFS
jgi:hypothetical protein